MNKQIIFLTILVIATVWYVISDPGKDGRHNTQAASPVISEPVTERSIEERREHELRLQAVKIQQARNGYRQMSKTEISNSAGSGEVENITELNNGRLTK